MIIGAHVSTSGGLVKACERAGDIGANGMQIFTGSPRMWKGKAAENFEVGGLREAVEKCNIEYLVIHATYLVNLASDKPELVSKSVDSLVNDMKIADKLAGEMGAESMGVVVHLGSHQGRGYEAMREQLVEQIEKVLKLSAGANRSRFLIENSAGQKGKIASRLSEVKDLIDGVGDPRLGWCFDTCHGFAAGYSLLANPKSQILNQKQSQNSNAPNSQQSQMSLLGDDGVKKRYTSYDIRDTKAVESGDRGFVFEEIDKYNLWKTLGCVHVNDSRDPFGSGRDRHANIGDGLIPSEELQGFVSEARVKERPLILEVPGMDGKGPDRENVELLKRLVG